MPLLRGWLVCCSAPQLIEDIRKAGDSDLSIDQWVDEVASPPLIEQIIYRVFLFSLFFFQVLQTPYTFGHDIRDDMYQIGVIRHSLPRNLAACFPDIIDEVQQSFEANLSLTGTGMGDVVL